MTSIGRPTGEKNGHSVPKIAPAARGFCASNGSAAESPVAAVRAGIVTAPIGIVIGARMAANGAATSNPRRPRRWPKRWRLGGDCTRRPARCARCWPTSAGYTHSLIRRRSKVPSAETEALAIATKDDGSLDIEKYKAEYKRGLAERQRSWYRRPRRCFAPWTAGRGSRRQTTGTAPSSRPTRTCRAVIPDRAPRRGTLPRSDHDGRPVDPAPPTDRGARRQHGGRVDDDRQRPAAYV